MSILDVFALLGGVGLFLYGMMQMSNGLKNAAGDHLRVILEKATQNRVVSVLVGVLVTLMIQSSSATDVMVIGFVNSGLMNLQQALGVIMGANIGTTVTAQLTAFNLSAYAPMILFVGVVMYLFMKKAQVRYVGSVIMGFGMLFEGIALMKTAIVPMSETPEFVAMLRGLSNPFLALLFGVAFTALVQSSSSSIAIFQTFAIQGILDYQTTVYLIIGAAIGSVTPNLLASLTTNRNGKRSAVLNLIFNLIRALHPDAAHHRFSPGAHLDLPAGPRRHWAADCPHPHDLCYLCRFGRAAPVQPDCAPVPEAHSCSPLGDRKGGAPAPGLPDPAG